MGRAGKGVRETLTDYSGLGGDAEIRDGLLVEGVPGDARRGGVDTATREHARWNSTFNLTFASSVERCPARNDFPRQCGIRDDGASMTTDAVFPRSPERGPEETPRLRRL